MSQLTEDEKNRLFLTLDLHTEQNKEMKKQNENIERALYGDEKNKVKGLLERVGTIEGWITDSKAKIVFWSGAAFGVLMVVKALWDWIKTKLGIK